MPANFSYSLLSGILRPAYSLSYCFEALFFCAPFSFCINKTALLFRSEIWNGIWFSLFLTDINTRRPLAPSSTLACRSASSVLWRSIAVTVTVGSRRHSALAAANAAPGARVRVGPQRRIVTE